MYYVKFTSYSDVTTHLEKFEDEEEARMSIVDIIKNRRFDGYVVTTLHKGEVWEVLEPEDAMLIPDDCGTLRLIHKTFECYECGSRQETKREAQECCSDYQRGQYE